MKNIVAFYNKMSNFGKILVLLTLFLIVIVIFKALCSTKEGMISTTEKISYKEGESVYDEFYTNIYDYLVYNNIKNDYEIGKIVNSTNPTEASIIVDIGCGTGHQVSSLSAKNLQVMGIDISPSMIQKAKENYPTGNYKIGDAQDSSLLSPMSATHILCLYFTLYYFKDKRQFFDNCMDWLMPGGYLVVHLVDREHFDPILPSGNPLYVVSPQKYAKERITKTKVVFNDFVYSANFDLNKDTDVALFDEKFKFNDGNVRKQQQKMYMEDTSVIVASAQDCGFILQGKIDLVKCAYEHQYLYVFVKPS